MFLSLYATYRNAQWLRVLSGLSLLLCGALLIVLGGFPPTAWRFLIQVVTTLPALWTMRGAFIVVPFIGLLLQSFLFFVLWLAWAFACAKAIQCEWELFQQRRELEGEYALDEEQELPQFVPIQNVPSPGVSASDLDTLPDTVYPRMPSSARRYPIQDATLPTVAQPVLTSSRIPARASAQLVAVRAPVQTAETSYSDSIAYADEETRDYDEECLEGLHFEQEKLEAFDELPPIKTVQKGLRLTVGIGSDAGAGPKKAVNEDTVLGLQDIHVTGTGALPVGLFIVADGMGGHANGQEASRLATCSVSEVVTPKLLGSPLEEVNCEHLLKDGIHYANAAIHQKNQQEFVMGTTITSALVFGSSAYIANVGDSRTYLYHEADGLTQITSDHSHVWQLFQGGLIEQEDIYTHPKRNEITRCLGERVRTEIDTFRVPLEANDVLLLCSDGLWEMVRNAEIERIIRDNAPYASQTSAKLIEAALRNGGADNVSVVVVCVTG